MRWLRKHLYDISILGVYVILTVALAWPLIMNMSTRLAGDDVDVLINPWADWWTRKALTENLDLYYTDYLFYPQGTSLVFHSFSHVTTAVSLLLKPLAGSFAAYNLAILQTFVISGFGMYLLAKYLTGCRPAAFIAGLVFAFHPYHVFQSSHPVLVTTQFIPLFILALMQAVQGAGENRRYRVGQTLLAALWFLLTALSSWHLMLMLASWAALYLLYVRFVERTRWTAETSRQSLLLVVLIVLTVTPFLWPIIREQLTTDATYMAADIEAARGNDLLSFFLPNRLHPVFGSLVLEINARIGYTRNTPAYLGYVALILAIVGLVANRSQTRFWWATGLLFFVLSLGPQLKWQGTPLHGGYLPWARPVTSVLRHPLRLNTLLFLSLAVLVAFGARWVFQRLLSWRTLPAHLMLGSVAAILLFEYWVSPFPTTQPVYSPFIDQLAAEEGDFAVADFPIDRQADKYYMFQQTIHGKKMIGGVVSRTPHDADAFIDANPLLAAIRNENVPDLYVRERMAVLAAQDVRYIILHKRFLDATRMAEWQKWLVHFPKPFYEDDLVIVFRTTPDVESDPTALESAYPLDVQVGEHIRLRGYRLSSQSLTAGDTLTVTLFWQSDRRMSEDYHVFVHLIDSEGQLVAQQDGIPVHGERPTWSWWQAEIIPDPYSVNIDPALPSGIYALSVGMYDFATGARLPAIGPTGEPLPEHRVSLQGVQVTAQE